MVDPAFFIFFDKFIEASNKASEKFVKQLTLTDPMAKAQARLFEDKYKNEADEYMAEALESLIISPNTEVINLIKSLRQNIQRRKEKWMN